MTDFVTITIKDLRGSAPRGVGTQMQVWMDRQVGSIGGGALEWQATRTARDMLLNQTQTFCQTLALGPSLGQCCGGSVTLAFDASLSPIETPQTPVWIWGAGHVGRALAAVLAPLPFVGVILADTHDTRLPDTLPDGVAPLIATDLTLVVPHAPIDAHHVILTYSHDIDLALCDRLLRHGFSTAGLIGSATKWTRFQSRLEQMGHAPAEISRIQSPIGDRSLGKHPAAIALGVATQLLHAVGTGELST